jgi:hypothetical protein
MHPHTRELLELMQLLRDSVCRVRATAPEFNEAQTLVRAIDRFAGALTGNPEHFWARPASFPVKKA